MNQCKAIDCLAPIAPDTNDELCPMCWIDSIMESSCDPQGNEWTDYVNSTDGPSVAPCGKPRKHDHYHKDVSHLDSIDIYRVLKLYDVTDHCLGHAIKKLLCAGIRGSKDMARDVQEAIDSLTRWQEIQREDAA